MYDIIISSCKKSMKSSNETPSTAVVKNNEAQPLSHKIKTHISEARYKFFLTGKKATFDSVDEHGAVHLQPVPGMPIDEILADVVSFSGKYNKVVYIPMDYRLIRIQPGYSVSDYIRYDEQSLPYFLTEQEIAKLEADGEMPSIVRG